MSVKKEVEGYEVIPFSGNIELKNKELEAFIDSFKEPKE